VNASVDDFQAKLDASFNNAQKKLNTAFDAMQKKHEGDEIPKDGISYVRDETEPGKVVLISRIISLFVLTGWIKLIFVWNSFLNANLDSQGLVDILTAVPIIFTLFVLFGLLKWVSYVKDISHFKNLIKSKYPNFIPVRATTHYSEEFYCDYSGYYEPRFCRGEIEFRDNESVIIATYRSKTAFKDNIKICKQLNPTFKED
jgi:hypothetical protein